MFATSENAVPTVLFGLLIPLMIAAVGLRVSESIASLASAIPLHWIVAAQVYRIGGGIFLVLWADGLLPWQFALPAGIGDVTTGIVAVVVAVLLAQKAPGSLRVAYGWCLFGIADLVVALTMGAMTSPASAAFCFRCAEPPHFILAAGDGPYFRRPAGLDAPWPRSVAAEAGGRLDGPAG